MAKVQVLGTGCSKCGYLFKNAQAAASERQAGDIVEVQDGKVARWKNLEEVWNHTGNQADFSAFIHQAWPEFKAS